MNRRNFFGEAATSFMACSGLAMYAVGSKLQRDLPTDADKEWFGDGWELWTWRMKSQYGNHTWIEFRETVFQRDGSAYTRPWNSLGAFTLTKVDISQHPIGKIEIVEQTPSRLVFRTDGSNGLHVGGAIFDEKRS